MYCIVLILSFQTRNQRLSNPIFLKNRNLPHRLAETDRRALCPRRIPGKQCGGHQRAAHHGRPEGEQAAVLSEPVTHGRCPLPPGSISDWNPRCRCASIRLGRSTSVNVHFYRDQWSQLCHAKDQSWREMLEVISNYNQTQLQSATAQFKNRTDGPAEVLLRPCRPGDAPTRTISPVFGL